MSRLTIRPEVKYGESLSSYLMRACQANMILYFDLLRHVQPIKSMDVFYRRSIRIDIMPQQKHDMRRLAMLLGQTEKSLYEMTFDSLRLKLNHYGLYLNDSFLTLMPVLLESNKRKFCTYCLKENIGYQMLWQVREIDVCLKHKVKLKTSCPICNHDQSYIHNNLGAYRCYHCGNYLFSENQQFHEANKECMPQRYNEWQYILDPKKQLFPGLVNGLDLQKTICITLIYILQLQLEESPTQYRYNLVSRLLRHDYLHSILRFINDETSPQKVTFPQIIKILNKIKISFKAFTKTKVPASYVNSIKLLKNQEKVNRKCLTPWCITFDKSDALKEIPFTHNSTFKKEKYSGASICDNCGIRYGYNLGTKQWSEIDNNIELIDKVVLMLWFDKNEKEIRKSLNISYRKLYEALGYALRYNLLPINKKETYRKYSQSDLMIVECFKELYLEAKIITHKARKWYGWHEIEFFYHFYNPIVQQYRWIEYTHKNKFNNKQKVLKVQPHIEKTLIDIIHLEEELTSKEIAASLNIEFINFKKYGFAKKVQEIKRQIQKNATESELLDKVQEYVKAMDQARLSVKCKDVYNYIGKSSNDTKKSMPSLSNFITEQSTLSKNKLRLYKMQDLMEKAENIILSEYYERNTIPLITELEKQLKIVGKIHTKYRPVLEHIKQTIRSLETGE
ncbi:TniQ family protein [Paenibacillus zanthoxyli]|uniref:TniQ family protein n=1 Tax=Paenibacillus zanthoxyli TaxID=369399 RepID=UPI00046E6B36|nr:TniQ family protein [Paenibacillus zanthoxyli]